MQSSVADGNPALLTTRPLPAPSIGELPEAQTTDTHRCSGRGTDDPGLPLSAGLPSHPHFLKFQGSQFQPSVRGVWVFQH